MAEDEGVLGSSAIGNGADDGPQVGLLSQYIKDLSFENPNAPAVYQWQSQPQIDVQFNIGSQQLNEEVYEVALKVDISACWGGGGCELVKVLKFGRGGGGERGGGSWVLWSRRWLQRGGRLGDRRQGWGKK
jgi:hypothetical protein